ncbi:AAA family ATPase [Alicyclobacillus cycloheptanicus]|uniref:AAA+ ATPase superfamily predicted ATPase n=1 Tax=Alicyclobacillus cycloheptanicus TaxID=1457 RepID=A0ABT9XIV4_9BACL|nr:ATP-binding protein [Alicyclobacillus cycloheptanicus]MDQ0190244.1 AAA+ ATPase superfamily predicted ATPase [Alicyclobacillus cycloheptanicus]
MHAVFPFGSVAQEEDVVDRERYIREMIVRMESGQSAIIAGPRRIGKSSVGREILRQLAERGQYTAAVDLFSVSSIEEFVAQLVEAILANRTGVVRRGIRTMEALRRLIGSAEIKGRFGDMEIGLNFADTDTAETDNLLKALSLAESLAEKDGRRMVILLDEFQDIERLGGAPLLKQFRATAQLQKQTTYLFLGSQPSMMKTLFSDRQQALYRFATFCPLPKIPAHAWEDYVQRKLEAQAMTITPAALGMILDLTGGHPYDVMGLVSHAYLLTATAGIDQVDADIVAGAEAQLMDHLTGIFEHQWLDVRKVKHADIVCLAICEQMPPYAVSASRSSVARALSHLLDLGIVEKRSARGAYRMVEPMFERWLRARFR